MTQKTIRLFDYISYRDEPWQVEAQEGTEVVLRNLATDRHERFPVLALLSDDAYEPEFHERNPSMESVSILDNVSKEVRAEVIKRHRDVVEILTGSPPPRLDEVTRRLEEYDPDLHNLGDRIDAKVAELERIGRPRSARSLKRDIAAVRERGIAGLVDRRAQRTSSRTGRVSDEVVGFLEDYLSEQADASTGTRTRAMMLLSHKAEDKGWTMPSERTLYRLLGRLDEGRSSFGDASTRQSKANRPQGEWGGQKPLRPGELVEIDSTKLDTLVLYPDGSISTVEVTAAIDVATRVPIAAIVSPKAAKSADAAILLAKALMPLPMQPGWNRSLAYSRSLLPEGVIGDDAEVLESVSAKPIIVPESITIDRGKVFIGNTFINACERMQISVTIASPRSPTDKPHIESFFKALREGFTQYLPGYKGQSVAKRGKSPEKDAIWAVNEIQNLLDLWIVGDYIHQPRDGLRLPFAPKRPLTPTEAYLALAGVAPQVSTQFSHDDYISFLPVKYHAIGKQGVSKFRLKYNSPELAPYRGKKSGLPSPANGKWEVRHDPYRMNSIWVRDHYKRKWIEAVWSADQFASGVFSIDVLKAAVAVLRSEHGTDIPGREMAREINRILLAPITVAERAASARSQANQGTIPRNDDDMPSDRSISALPNEPEFEEDYSHLKAAARFD